MKRTLTLLALVGLLLTPNLWAADPIEAERIELDAVSKDVDSEEMTTLVIVNDTFEKSKLTDNYKIVAKAVSQHLKKATFKVHDNELLVGLPIKDVAKGAQIAKIEFNSDCPDNSQFTVEETPAILAGVQRQVLKEILTAWTKARHNAPDAELRVVNVSQRDRNFNYDVRLNLKKVASLDR